MNGAMVEVFKTNVQKRELAATLLADLSQRFPLHKINFDLDDCDRILRIEGKDILPEEIIGILQVNGCEGQVLE